MTEFINIQADQQPAGVTDEDWADAVLSELYAHTEDLGLLINTKIEQRTPVLTGALKLGETFTPNNDKNNPTLVDFSPTAQTQIDEWGRIYAQYIEGIASSPTIHNPSHMYELAESEDTAEIEWWAQAQIQRAVDKLTGGP